MTIKTKLPAKLETEAFLATSHFKIGKEPQWLDQRDFYQSTFEKDYTPKYKPRTQMAKKPPVATILQKDDSIYEQCSVSHEQFVKKNVKRSNACKSLNQTNFKMDKDKRIESFLTTQASSYQVNSPDTKNGIPTNPMKSHIPQGDPEKEAWPESDYTNTFYEKKIDLNNLKRFRNNVLSKTIQGDIRSHRGNDIYNTSTKDMFPLRECQMRCDISESVKYPRTSIPSGDSCQFVSTQKSSFGGRQNNPRTNFFRKADALRELQRTSFVNGDSRLNSFETTTNQCYPYPDGKGLTAPLLTKRDKLYNDITIPATKMISSASSDYVAPPSTYRHRIIDGSSYHTASEVCLGNDKQTYYTTTMKANFPQKTSKYKKRTDNTCTSHIPLQYYDNVYANTSYNLNFTPKGLAPKLVLNKSALHNLRDSHICKQISGLREFKTTQNELYTYKKLPPQTPLSKGRLQRSSVPLGTMVTVGI